MLNPVLRKDCPRVLRVGGRLKTGSHLPEHTRHPIILPQHHRITQPIVDAEDRKCWPKPPLGKPDAAGLDHRWQGCHTISPCILAALQEEVGHCGFAADSTAPAILNSSTVPGIFKSGS